MAEHSRYDVGNDDGVLKNKLGITNQKDLEDTETVLLSDAYRHFFEVAKDKKIIINLGLIVEIHKYFLHTLYSWAGTLRTVEISKNGILFCPHSQIQKELENFKQILTKNTPTEKDTKKIIARKLAIIHCEFNAIHPFREGNGRTIRLFLDLIADHSRFSPIDYNKSRQQAYIDACIAGMRQDYSKMERIILKGLS